MRQGYQIRIDSIVNKMVEGEVQFNKKTIKQQDEDKANIATSISNAIAVLNNEGQKIVLDELDSRANQKSHNIFDSSGNISTSEVIKITNSIVKATIEYADRNGINLMRNSTIPKKDMSLADGILTVAIMNKMIDDYQNLSFSEKNILISNYRLLSEAQKDRLAKQALDELEGIKESTTDERTKEIVNKQKENIGRARKLERESKNISDNDKSKSYDILRQLFPEYFEKFEKTIKSDHDLTDKELFAEFATFLTQNNIALGASTSKDVKENGGASIETVRSIENTNILISVAEFIVSKQYESLGLTEKTVKTMKPFDIYMLIVNNKPKKGIENALNEDFLEAIEHNENLNENPNQDEPSGKMYEKINHIYFALGKANFSEGEISDALEQYKSYFENLSQDDIDFLTEQTDKDRAEILREEFGELQVDSQTSKILHIMAGITFDGKMQQILTDKETREAFLQELENVATRGIDGQEDIQLDGELEAVFSSFFEKNAVDMEVAEPATLTEIAGEEFGEENPVGFEDIPQEPVIGMDVDFESDILGMETEEESSIPTSEEGYTETLAAEEMEVEQPQVFDMAGLFDAQIAKDIFGEEGSRADLGQAIDFLNALGKDMQNPNKSKVQDENENEVTALDDSGNDNR